MTVAAGTVFVQSLAVLHCCECRRSSRWKRFLDVCWHSPQQHFIRGHIRFEV
jgi:hypothetical protein